MNPDDAKLEILSFYLFTSLNDAQQQVLTAQIEDLGTHFGLRGLVLLGTEGINLTASGTAAAIAELRRRLDEVLDPPAAQYKYARAVRHPFQILRIKVRDEIVTLGRPDIRPSQIRNHHLTPAEWHRALSEDDVVVLDTRNDYEVDLGKFKTARDLNTKEFREFPERLRAAEIPKDQKILIYCTGGIRCEKAILEMHAQGFANVHQLEGGILNYLREYPDEHFAGECFVFDYRVAVDQRLRPTTRFGLCPHCGQPANVDITCVQCESVAVVCAKCQPDQPTCSKNCAHHRAIGSKSRRPHGPEGAKRRRVQSTDSSSAPAGG